MSGVRAGESLRQIVRVAWLGLARDRVALGMTFVLPIVFFSVFASIFGNLGGGSAGELEPLEVVAIDQDGSAASRRLLDELAREPALRVLVLAPAPPSADALAQVRAGKAAAAIVVPPGFGDRLGRFDAAEPARVAVHYDAANPMAQHTVGGLLQAASFRAAPGALVRSGLELFERFGGPLSEQQRGAVAALDTALAAGGAGALPGVLVSVDASPAQRDQQNQPRSLVAYYAAGVGVMFLLFSMTNAASSLLEEQEQGTLERLLQAQVGMRPLLFGRFGFYSALGAFQLALMFVFGALVFGFELFTAKRLAGVAVMVIASACAAAAFALVLATIARSRAQLSGLSTVVILMMSALGGSMVPRFIMPRFMEPLSRFTFNGWALDGFLKVLWYDTTGEGVGAQLLRLLPQVGVLLGATGVFLWLALRLARRWEAL